MKQGFASSLLQTYNQMRKSYGIILQAYKENTIVAPHGMLILTEQHHCGSHANVARRTVLNITELPTPITAIPTKRKPPGASENNPEWLLTTAPPDKLLHSRGFRSTRLSVIPPKRTKRTDSAGPTVKQTLSQPAETALYQPPPTRGRIITSRSLSLSSSNGAGYG